MRARLGGQVLGEHLVVGYGDTLSHFIDWQSQEGRRRVCLYLMFWQSILLAKQLGYRFFDVGGLNPATWPTVAEFKRRMRPEKYCLIGEYVYSLWPIPFRRYETSFVPPCLETEAACDSGAPSPCTPAAARSTSSPTRPAPARSEMAKLRDRAVQVK